MASKRCYRLRDSSELCPFQDSKLSNVDVTQEVHERYEACRRGGGNGSEFWPLNKIRLFLRDKVCSKHLEEALEKMLQSFQDSPEAPGSKEEFKEAAVEEFLKSNKGSRLMHEQLETIKRVKKRSMTSNAADFSIGPKPKGKLSLRNAATMPPNLITNSKSSEPPNLMTNLETSRSSEDSSNSIAAEGGRIGDCEEQEDTERPSTWLFGLLSCCVVGVILLWQNTSFEKQPAT